LKKILLIRFSSIGDIVLVSPIIRALKTQLNCQLHVLSKAKYKLLYDSNPYIDKVHVFDVSEKEIIPLLKNEEFDYIIDLQKNIRSYNVYRRLKIPRYTFPKINLRKWLIVNFKINTLPKIHIVDRYFEAVKKLGVKNDLKGLDYFTPESAFVNLDKYPVLNGNKFIGFVIGGQHKTKMLPVEKIVSIINQLPIPVVLLGGPEDKSTGEEIKKQISHPHVMNACGSFSLHQSTSLVRQAALIITNDTGLMHVAAAFRKPIISIWGNTIPEFGMYPYEPDTPENVVIAEVKGLSCRPCSKIGFEKCPKGHFNCMMKQDEQFIVSEAVRILKDKINA